MHNNKIVELTVGFFVIAAILSLLMLALQVSGLSHFFHRESQYKIAIEFNNIGGLKPRAKVAIAGVVIGRVTQVQLEPKTFVATALVSIDQKKLQEKLPTDTRASIMTAGLLGDSYIAITPGFSETVLENGGVIPEMNTDSAIVLEQLISKFVANQASSPSKSNALPPLSNPSSNPTPENALPASEHKSEQDLTLPKDTQAANDPELFIETDTRYESRRLDDELNQEPPSRYDSQPIVNDGTPTILAPN